MLVTAERLGLLAGLASAQGNNRGPRASATRRLQPQSRMRSVACPSGRGIPSGIRAQPDEHPLMPALRWAHDGLENIEKTPGLLGHAWSSASGSTANCSDYEYMFVKVRHKPFSVYMYFLGPATLKGQEVHLRRRPEQRQHVGPRRRACDKLFGTVSLKPDRPDRHEGPALSDHRARHSQPDPPAGRGRRAGHASTASARSSSSRARRSTTASAPASRWSTPCRGATSSSTWPGSSSTTN